MFGEGCGVRGGGGFIVLEFGLVVVCICNWGYGY